MKDELKLSELLAVKLCHDLAGPIGAVNNGTELLREANDNLFEQSLDLVDASAKDAIARLLYFRQAYGSAPSQGETSIESLKTLADNFFADKKITLDWQTDSAGDAGRSISNEQAKILLNLILVTSGALIYGGMLFIKTSRESISVRGEGKAVKLDMEVLGLLSDFAKEHTITIKNVHAYLVAKIAQNMSATSNVSTKDNYIEITVS
jgi:histidine phosphotransferase ChpT